MPSAMRNLLNWFVNFQHLVLLSTVLFFLIIGVAFMLVYQNAMVMRDMISEDFNEQQLILARQATHQIDAHLHDIEINLESLIHLLVKLPASEWEEALRSMGERTRFKGLMEIGIADSMEKILALEPGNNMTLGLPPGFLADCRWNDEGSIILGPMRVIEPTPGAGFVTSILCSRISSPLIDDGFLFARLNVSQLLGSVASHIKSGKTGYAWILDESGVFLYHPVKEFVGKNALTARKQRKPKISFTQINRIMKEQMLRGEEGSGLYTSGWHGGLEGDLTKLVAFAPVKSTTLSSGRGWSVAVAAPISEVAAAVRRVYTRHFGAEAALIVGMFVFGLLGAIYQNRMSRALEERVKETEADLHDKERIYKRMVEQATDLIYVVDLDMRVLIFNHQAADMFSDTLIQNQKLEGAETNKAQVAEEELWGGKSIAEMMGPVDAAFLRSKMDMVLERKKSLSYEHSVMHKGLKVRLSTKLIPVRDDEGEVHYVLGISRDMTEKMEMDQRIYNAEKLASIGILASGVAHEINNPLAIILGFTDLLLERFPEDSPEHEDLKMVEQNANLAKKVVENLLGFARITEGLEDTVDLKNSIETVIQIVKNTLMTKKVEFSADIPDNLPRVRGDAREFQQVIFNLINNAVAAMTDHDSDIERLSLSARSDHQWVHVIVEDSGMGIPDRIKPHIFDPFFTTKKVGEGTGLGLSLCYGIVKKYGGKISLESVSAEDHPNRPTGTKFIVSMQVHKEDDPHRN